MINEAFFVLAEGDASATEIDEGMTLGCNHPMGPLALADLIGLDVLLAVMQTITTSSAIRNTGPARCSERWSPRVTSVVKRAVVSTGTDVAVRTALTTAHQN
jgi:3-hydroxyacyl-CoA dehydrogenase